MIQSNAEGYDITQLINDMIEQVKEELPPAPTS
jgi:hypothetical protein